eukprot:jgi/Mesen1/3677/ME000202S02766
MAEHTADRDGASGPKPLTKFSFAMKAGPSRGAQATGPVAKKRDEEVKDFVTGMGDEGLVSKDGAGSSRVKVIPKQENTWQPYKKQKKHSLPGEESPGNPEDRFEMETVEAGPVEGVQYGLTLRKAPVNDEGEEHDVELKVANSFDPEAQKLKEDLIELPDEADLDAYESMPVENFGEAMLKGMGWVKGKALGKNAKGLVEPVEYVPRQTRLGLGATPKEIENNKKFIKPGEKRGSKPTLVAPVGADGRVRHVKAISEGLVEHVRPGVQVGKTMEIVDGRHQGMRAVVLSVEKQPPDSKRSDKATVRLVRSDEEVVVRVQELADIGSAKAEERGSARKEKGADAGRLHGRAGRERSQREGEEEHRSRDHHRNNGHRESEHANEERRQGPSESKGRTARGDRDPGGREPLSSRYSDRHGHDSHPSNGVNNRDDAAHHSSDPHQRLAKSWLTSHIRVRIISKVVGEGRLYLKKATILDVTTPTTCDVIVADSRELVKDLRQGMLETALPKTGGQVMVLRGEHKGQRGELLKKNSETESAVVQLEDTLEMVVLSLDDLAEHVGSA